MNGIVEKSHPQSQVPNPIMAARAVHPGPDHATSMRSQREYTAEDDSANLARRLVDASTFEQAAQDTLRALVRVLAAVLPASTAHQSRGVESIRALIHLRPDRGDEGLVTSDGGAITSAVSRSLWQRLPGDGRAVWLNHRGDRPDAAPGVEHADTLIMPLHSGKHRCHGVAAVVLDRALGPRAGAAWPCAARLQTLVNIATPWLLALPRVRSPLIVPDPSLPVMGAAMRPIVELLAVFARQDETILIAGPTGAGKSRLARWCHERSGRRGSFQTVDLLSVPEHLQMAELFGWKRGSFTGAVNDRDGCVAASEGGTLFIDEIDKLSMKAQAGLLHLLETRQYRVLGDAGHLRSADVRFVVGTNADLGDAVAAGQFREDLYYRVQVLPVHVPPLAERTDEIDAWARFMLARRHRQSGASGTVELSAEASLRLMELPWPGNLRQLDNLMRRAYAVALSERAVDDRSDVVILLRHVERARELGCSDTSSPLLRSLRHTARAFFAEAERRAELGDALDVQHAQAFTGLVLEEGVRRLGDPKQAYRILRAEQILRSRNHWREYRREADRVTRLARALGARTDVSDNRPGE